MLPTVDRLATIVVCEDDAATRELLCDNLEADRYDALAAGTAEEALRFCRYGTPDALIVDIGLPDASGLDVIREIRAATDAAAPFDADLPIVALSGRGSDGDRVRGLRAGADDYLVKPFALDELLARVRALLRRTSPAGLVEVVRVGDLVLDPRRRQAQRGERTIELTKTEFELLELLMVNAGIVLERSVIYDRIWGYDFETGSKSLDVYIGYLRRKTEEGGEPRLIHTVRGVGYVLRPDERAG